MPERKIYILTGAIQTGKTTALVNWCAGKKNVSGILTPVINGKRFFMDVSTREQFAMEAAEDEKEILFIGRFHFSKAAFERAIQIIRGSMGQPGWLIIDEIGPLEIRKEGFYNVVTEILKKDEQQNILMVVRDSMVEKVMGCFQLGEQDVQIIKGVSELAG